MKLSIFTVTYVLIQLSVFRMQGNHLYFGVIYYCLTSQHTVTLWQKRNHIGYGQNGYLFAQCGCSCWHTTETTISYLPEIMPAYQLLTSLQRIVYRHCKQAIVRRPANLLLNSMTLKNISYGPIIQFNNTVIITTLAVPDYMTFETENGSVYLFSVVSYEFELITHDFV